MKSLKVQKSNSLNEANFSEFNLSVYRVFLTIISKMQKHDFLGNHLPLTNINRECSLSAIEYAKEFNINVDTAYTILKESVDKLFKTSYEHKINEKVYERLAVCSRAVYNEHATIDIKFTEEIMPHLAELSNNFTMYDLKEISRFGSIYSTRLYELLMQFKTTGLYEVTISDLRFHLGCVDCLKQYAHFKVRAISHAVNEINSIYDIDLEFKAIKTGRSVGKLIFTFRKLEKTQAYDTVKQKMRTQIQKPKRKKLKDDSSNAAIKSQHKNNTHPVSITNSVSAAPKQEVSDKNNKAELYESLENIKRKKWFGIF